MNRMISAAHQAILYILSKFPSVGHPGVDHEKHETHESNGWNGLPARLRRQPAGESSERLEVRVSVPRSNHG